MGGSRGPGVDGNESDDANSAPSETGNSSNKSSTDSSEESDNDEPAALEEDLDEIGSDAGYESYGLADF